MLLSSRSFANAPLMSLQTGSQIGSIAEPIIDPRQLRIVAYYVEGPLLDVSPAVIRIEDIREIGEIGFITDSSDEIISPSDVIRLQQIIDMNFNLINIHVIDEKKHSLGKVLDYNFHSQTFDIEQLRVKPPILKTIQVSELMIHRNQIIKVTNEHIVVKSLEVESKATSKAPLGAHAYTNPFRAPQPEQP